MSVTSGLAFRESVTDGFNIPYMPEAGTHIYSLLQGLASSWSLKGGGTAARSGGPIRVFNPYRLCALLPGEKDLAIAHQTHEQLYLKKGGKANSPPPLK